MKKLLLFIVIFSLAVGQNYSLQFDGVDDYVEISNAEVLQLSNQFTIQVNIKIDDFNIYTGYEKTIISKIVNGNWYGGYELTVVNDGFFSFTANFGGQNHANEFQYENYDWNNITVTYDGFLSRLYLNGILMSQNEEGSGSVQTSDLPLRFGKNADSGSAPDFLDGSIDNILMWNIPLTQEEIQANMYTELTGNEDGLVGYWNFNEGSGTTLTDHSGNGNHGTIYGATWSEDVPTLGCTDPLATNYNAEANFDDGSCTFPDNGDYSLSFDGNDDYVSCQNNSSGTFSAVTVEGWINVSSYPNIDYGKIFDIGGNAGRIILSSSYTNGFEFVISENNVNNDAMAQIHDFNTTDSWIHIAGVWDGLSFIHLYINGIIIASNTIPSTIISVSINPSSPMEIGRRYSGVDYFHGLISNLSFWNIALDSTQIQQYMISPPIGSEEGLIANWNFNDGSGEILYDHSGNQNHGTINGATWVLNTDFESLTISPLSLNFGEVRLGESGELTVDFGNNGEEELSVNITPTDQLSVSLDDFIVYPGSSVPINVTYTPTVEGDFLGSLNILSNDVGDPDFELEVTGNGIAEPIINISPDSLHFDVVVFDDTLATQTLTIENTGYDTLEVSLNQNNFALHFDGVDDYVDVGSGFNIISEMTFEARIKTNYSGSNNVIFTKRHTEPNDYPTLMTHDGKAVISVDDSGYRNDINSVSYVTDNEWHYIAGVKNGNQYSIFVDGVLESTEIDNHTMSGSPYNAHIGHHGAWSKYFYGLIDEVHIYNRALTQEEIQANMYAELTGNEEGLVGYWNFNEGEGNILHDRSGNGNDGTIYGATWVESPFLTSVNWLTLSETTLTIPPGESANVEVTANANGYECGDYDGSIQLTTNDPENPAIEIPVNMSVLYPTALVDESPINFGEVGFNNTAEIQVPVMNDGCYSLEAIASLENANLTISPDTLFVEAGDTSFFTITMASDMDEAEIESNLVFSYNDPSNNSDTISVSATIVPDIHPIITNIEDIPNDQGGKVLVYFTRSYHDTDSLRVPESYTVETNYGNGWILTSSGNGHAESNYIIQVSTNIDSSSTSDGLLDFRIIAGMEEGNFVSEVVTGYSVDNIIPSELSGLTVSSASSENITLDWTANIDDDLAGYNIYRDNEEPSFSTVSGYSDNEPLNTHFTYIVKAVDVHGNESIGSRMYMNRHQLAFGNNLISLPGILENDSSQDLLNEIIGDGTDVVFLLGQAGGYFNTDDGWVGNLINVDPYSGYWINTADAYEWILEFEGGTHGECKYYPSTSTGNNLLSYKWGSGNSSTMDALGGEAFASANFNFILGQAGGYFKMDDGWVGNLTTLEEGKGYWVNISNENIVFRWGFDNCAEPTESSVLAKTESTIPQEYRVNQSTQQAFYLIKELIIDGNYPVAEDLILAYHNNILVGSTNYSELTVLPIMGRDMSEQTIGFIEAGQVPQLKLLKANGELVDLQADLEPFNNLLVSEVQTVTGSTVVIPNEYALHPAFPNPFNPITNISYGLPMDTQVTLNIYNVEGRKISTLTEGIRTARNHTIEWNAEGYPSGVYFVKLDADRFSETQKLMLVK